MKGRRSILVLDDQPARKHVCVKDQGAYVSSRATLGRPFKMKGISLDLVLSGAKMRGRRVRGFWLMNREIVGVQQKFD